MLFTEKQILWRISSACLGAALPMMLFERTALFALIILGATAGILATKGNSLRATMTLLKESRLVWLILAILSSFAISSAFSINPAGSWDKYLQLWIVAFVALGVFIALREMPGRHVEGMMKSLTITTAICSIIALVDASGTFDRLSLFLHNDLAFNPYRLNFYSGALAVILPFVWARMVTKKRENEPFAKMIFVPLLVLTMIALVVAGGRIGWVGALTAMTIFIGFSKYFHNIEFQIKHAFWTIVTLVLGIVGYYFAHGADFFVSRVDLNSSPRGFGGGRGEIWHLAWSHCFDNPIFGIGVNAFRYLPGNADTSPHSAPLQLLLETGFVGLALTLALCLSIALIFFKYAKHTIYGVAAFSSLAAFCAVSLANTSIFNIWWTAFFVMLCLIGWRTGWASDRELTH